ncbi:unnamed protein product [marine sediment metagenome]|uniref:Uncharacterized protein n=1 Tax=marine sediment metagenome TaxID=412755 RepID=X1HLB1_9ZZZZ
MRNNKKTIFIYGKENQIYMKHTIRIPIISPTGNELKRILYKTPYKYKELRTAWGWEFTVFKVSVGKAKGKRKVTVVSLRKKICDYDNFIAGLKPVFDAMQDTGLIINDDAKYLEHGNHGQFPGKKIETVITIEDV